MSLKKLLGVILIIVIVMFTLMLTTSYAWYSFSESSTTFNAVTSNDSISVTFRSGEYINTTSAVPISSEEIDNYSEKNNFSIRVRDNEVSNSILVTISLVDIAISSFLQNENFKIDLLYQGNNIASYDGKTIGNTGSKDLTNVTLNNNIDNNFELRVYILDDDSDQSSMMNQTFQAKIQINVVSRLKTVNKDYKDADISISSITIDGVVSDYLPISGLYDMDSNCEKGSVLNWDSLSRTIIYGSGSKVKDRCNLSFSSKKGKIYLNQVTPGSYVKYVGSNGCNGKSCEGQNNHYKNDNVMGYCSDSNYQFIANGWRVAYIKDDTAYLVSAGSPECGFTYVDSKSSSSSQSLDKSYYYGSGYSFDSSTGEFSLTGVTSNSLVWNSNYNHIISNTPYTCKSSSSTGTCSTLYEVITYSDSNHAIAYPHFNYEMMNGTSMHLTNLNNIALKYCNKKYAFGGVCDEHTSWAMRADDFQNMIGKSLSSISCYKQVGDKTCGYMNDLIDIGSYYWYGTLSDDNFATSFFWDPSERYINSYHSNGSYGVRPILRLDSKVVVLGGTGTYKDPYILGIS